MHMKTNQIIEAPVGANATGIISLRADEAPCNFTEQEIVAFAEKAEQEYTAGVGMMSHEDFMQEVATWQR